VRVSTTCCQSLGSDNPINIVRDSGAEARSGRGSRPARSPLEDIAPAELLGARTGRISGTMTAEDPQIRSGIGKKENQRQTLRSLGLKRVHDVVIKEDRPEIRGMVATVPHLVSVEEVD
jgi:large subunit ribosomal protein L30